MSNFDEKGKNNVPESPKTVQIITSSEPQKPGDHDKAFQTHQNVPEEPFIIECPSHGHDETATPLKGPPIIEKTLASAASLSQLLPSNTVFAFQALAPSFTNGGNCCLASKCFTIALIAFCALSCIFFTFTDTFKDEKTGKFYLGLATVKGFYVINTSKKEKEDIEKRIDREEFRLRGIDCIHAIVSVFVFLAFALSDANVVLCLFSNPDVNLKTIVIDLPLVLSSLASLIFFIYPTSRKGLGYSEPSAPKTVRLD